ncbi:MAG TPA: hypothetical protein VL049_19395 [Candidatus Dormibacteraeota bacterium]|nr:hypothetical protein [Candidatus Dormibacteraeota bacterium]
MSDREHLRRKDAVRTSPYRNWSTLFRPADPCAAGDRHAASENGSGAAASESWSDVVSRGVDLGYKVIDEQIRQGQRVAEQIGSQSYGPWAMGGDAQELGERLLRSTTDAMALWFELLTGVFGRADLLRPFAREATAPGHAPVAVPTAVSVEVASARPARVTLELQPNCAAHPLAAFELRALDASKPPLSDVAFDADPSGKLVSVRVHVPDGQAPGVYSGVVVDRESGQPRGTLSVRVAA